LGDSKLLWPSMATVYEGLCGGCVNGVELIRCDQLKNKSSRRVTYGNPCYSIGSKADSIYFLDDRSVLLIR
jgi:predicted amidophosphoribosyltransferase